MAVVLLVTVPGDDSLRLSMAVADCLAERPHGDWNCQGARAECCRGFVGRVSQWDVSGVTSMVELFRDATEFDQDISGWDTSGVTTMEGMCVSRWRRRAFKKAAHPSQVPARDLIQPGHLAVGHFERDDHREDVQRRGGVQPEPR